VQVVVRHHQVVGGSLARGQKSNMNQFNFIVLS